MLTVSSYILPPAYCVLNTVYVYSALPTTVVMYKTIFVINIIIHMCLQHSNTL